MMADLRPPPPSALSPVARDRERGVGQIFQMEMLLFFSPPLHWPLQNIKKLNIFLEVPRNTGFLQGVEQDKKKKKKKRKSDCDRAGRVIETSVALPDTTRRGRAVQE